MDVRVRAPASGAVVTPLVTRRRDYLDQPRRFDRLIPKHLGRASLDDLAGRQASWTRYRYPAVFGPVVTHLVTHRSVMAHTSRGGHPPPRNGRRTDAWSRTANSAETTERTR